MSPSVHPHVCGENRPCPRCRPSRPRFTPTCVGKTHTSFTKEVGSNSVHPHVCGENVRVRDVTLENRQVHPHVCGENFLITFQSLTYRPVHPHVCGENALPLLIVAVKPRFTPTCVGKTDLPLGSAVLDRGSPPRVWGKPYIWGNLAKTAVSPIYGGNLTIRVS